MVLHVVAVLGRKIIRPEDGVLPVVFALMDAGDERSLGAWWTGGLLFGAALAAVLVARLAAGPSERRQEVLAWWVMAGLFALLSLDEIVSLHERGAKLTGAVMEAGSPLAKFGWLLPGTALIVLFAGVLIPAFRAIPSRPRGVMIAGFATSIAGAAGMEIAYVVLLDAEAAWRWLFLVMVIEEAAEITGVLIILAGISIAVQIIRTGEGLTLRYKSCDRTVGIQPDYEAVTAG
jgi:hypothetical protein